MKKTWQEKLEDKASLPKVLKLEKRFPYQDKSSELRVN